ncbi:MAG: helix-turn-helix domain-containing protein [Sphingobacteriaceae bacterium]
MFQLASYVCFLTFGIGIVFCTYLFLRFREFKATWFLLALIICLSITEFYMYALSSRTILQMPFLFRMAFPFRMLYGPLLFCYVRTMLYPEKPFSIPSVLHFIPAIIITLCLIPDFFAPNAYKLEVLSGFYNRNTVFIDYPTGIIPPGLLQPFTIGHGMVYSLLSLSSIYVYRRKRKNTILLANRMVLRWIFLVSIVVAIFIAWQLLQYLSLSLGHRINAAIQIFQSLSLIILKGYLLVSPHVIENMDGCINADVQGKNPSEHLIPLPLSGNENEAFHLTIKQYFLNNKSAYLNPQFALQDMAAHLGLTPKKLSVLLTQQYGIHFTELVNRYRIGHLISLMQEGQGRLLKLEALITLCGFQYRSSFYSAFKKIMKNTPSAYFKDRSPAGNRSSI